MRGVLRMTGRGKGRIDKKECKATQGLSRNASGIPHNAAGERSEKMQALRLNSFQMKVIQCKNAPWAGVRVCAEDFDSEHVLAPRQIYFAEG
jgi:hypothetical protein